MTSFGSDVRLPAASSRRPLPSADTWARASETPPTIRSRATHTVTRVAMSAARQCRNADWWRDLSTGFRVTRRGSCGSADRGKRTFMANTLVHLLVRCHARWRSYTPPPLARVSFQKSSGITRLRRAAPVFKRDLGTRGNNFEAAKSASANGIREFPKQKLEAPPGFEPGMEVLQTSALPLGDGAVRAACSAEEFY